MRPCRSAAAAALFVILGAATPLAAQTTMAGIVRDDSTGRPLPGVEVLLAGTTHTAITNAAGRYFLDGLPAGNHQAIFRIVGYLPARVTVLLSAGDTLRVNQVLVPSTVVLDPIEVTGEPDVGLAGRGFHERMKMGFGRFYESAELRELEHVNLSDVLRRKGGIGITQLGFNGPMIAMHPTSRNKEGFLDCVSSVYIDGVRIFAGGKTDQMSPSEMERIPDLRRYIPVGDVEAIEVYRSSAQIPIQFGGSTGQCGAVVLWTRRAP